MPSGIAHLSRRTDGTITRLRSERYRYIRYADGSEELYDHTADPNEWNNLASEASLSNVKAELAKWFPAVNAEDAERDN